MSNEQRFHNLATALPWVRYAVEANTFEHMVLWQKYHESVNWEHVSSGFMPTVGYVDEKPVVLSVMFTILNGEVVLFYHPTSRMVDHGLIDAWLEAHVYPHAREYFESRGSILGLIAPQTDAMNFHICVHALAEAKEYERTKGAKTVSPSPEVGALTQD
ncbi:hypothetical protein LC612_39085 [Nostoc sp. CHAB 5834]|nr:hypothetical protein [Nostoc sp. CHAB 5834]